MIAKEQYTTLGGDGEGGGGAKELPSGFPAGCAAADDALQSGGGPGRAVTNNAASPKGDGAVYDGDHPEGRIAGFTE